MEEIIISLVLLAAVYYIYKHVKKVMTVGEDGSQCASCPVMQMRFDPNRIVKKSDNSL
ncbi:MAG: hypothetical protein AB7T22_14740 [Calditrichaceae bacterium]